MGSPSIEPAATDDVGKRDQTCRVTASTFANEIAHIIPQALSEWWQRNSMFAYAANPDLSADTRCADNAILLRRDLHKMWDDHRFAIVPKEGKWVIHGLWRSPSDELETMYHNLELQPLYGVARHFLLCRFALAIFSKSVFLNQSVPRRLLTLDREDAPQVQSMSSAEYRDLFPPARRANSRSTSPKKRARSARGNDEGDVDGGESGGETSGSDNEERGRPQKRRWPPAGSLDWVFGEMRQDEASLVDALQHALQTPPRSAGPASS